jgi:broad specificity phosphatase PhoE
MESPTTQHSNTPSTTLIGLLRHGITLWNEGKRIQGSMDSPLSAQGKEMTRAWAKQLMTENWDRIVASDLGRVKETVAILNTSLNLPLFFDPRLQEMYWGRWEGLPVREVYSQEAALVEKMVQAGWEFRPPEGESRKEALNRARSVINEAVSRWPGQKILVVCHLGIIKCLICDSVGSSFLPGETPSISKNSLHLLEATSTGFNCLKLNIPLRANV